MVLNDKRCPKKDEGHKHKKVFSTLANQFNILVVLKIQHKRKNPKKFWGAYHNKSPNKILGGMSSQHDGIAKNPFSRAQTNTGGHVKRSQMKLWAINIKGVFSTLRQIDSKL